MKNIKTWTFSETADRVVGACLLFVLVATIFA